MKKCNVCNKVKGKRKCTLNGDEFICPPCCAKIRNVDCLGCSYYSQEEKPVSEKTDEKNTEHFTVMLDEKLDDKVDSILQLVEIGQVEIGNSKMKSLFSRYPNYHSVLYGMGVICIMQGKEDEALPYFEKAVKIFPLFSEAWFNKAMIHKKRLEIYEYMISLQKVAKYSTRGTSLEKQANELLNDCATNINKESGLDLDSYIKFMGIYKIAYAKLISKKYSEAIIDFKKVLEQIPKHYQSWGNLGLCYGHLGDKQTAIECCEKAIKIYPKYRPAITNLAIIKNLREGESLRSFSSYETNFIG
ncbi:MAG: tetratricopeptide repeat protein [Bacteroidota bacterium]